MNPDLYTDEFRNFKYLKSTPEQVQYYKDVEETLQRVQPWAATSDPDFRWETRLEFFEQLLDLRDGTAYFVELGLIYSHAQDKNVFDWEDSRLIEIVHPLLYEGHPLMADEGRPATIEDIPILEDYQRNSHFYLCSGDYPKFCRDREVINVDNPGQVYKLDNNPLVCTGYIPYTAMFYDKTWAQKYQRAITDFLRKNNDAVSAISRLI